MRLSITAGTERARRHAWQRWVRRLRPAGLAVLLLLATHASARQESSSAPLETGIAREDAHAAIAACLAHPGRACALTSALRAVAAQDLAFDRVETLIALARAFHALGDDARAASAAALAVKAARAIGISIGTERKLREIAPLEAAIGRIEDARSLLGEIADPAARAATLADIARARARVGDYEGALKLLDEVSEPWLALAALAEIAESAAAEDDTTVARLVKALEERVEQAPRHLLKWLAMARLAALEARAGEIGKARAVRDDLADHVAPGLGYSGAQVRLWAALALLDLALDDRAAYDLHVARMLRRVRSVTIDQDPTTAIAEAMTALAAGGRTDEALALAGRFGDPRGLSELAKALLGHPFARSLWAPVARRIVDSLKDEASPAEQDRARLVALCLLIAAGLPDEALAVARDLHDDDARARALAMLAPHLG